MSAPTAPDSPPASGGWGAAYVPRVLLRHLASAPEVRVRPVDGTCVFMDVSGFTKLSERLARRGGREGAEQLAAAIGGCFERLLTVAYADGGALLKFGGDALLLLFEGEGDVARACRSAVAMRRLLRESGPVDVGGVRVRLRMSVGVHSDRYHLFVVGGSHRELLITGPAATEVVRMEKQAGSGEIVVSDATAAALPARCVGAATRGGRLLRAAPDVAYEAVGHEAWTPDPAVVADALSTGLRAHVLAGPQSPEHRMATVAFLRFEGIDALIAARGAEAASEALHELTAAVQGAADEQQLCFLGSDVDADGGKLILTAGAPRASGDDEERMLLALRRSCPSASASTVARSSPATSGRGTGARTP
jgi:class 3 adenylate cyclase